jgi:Tfp pilus assembly protein PilF
LTNGPDGLLRWPIRADTANAERMRIGPPERINVGTFAGIDCDRKGELIIQSNGMGALVFRPGKWSRTLGPHPGAVGVAISPDGRYAATGNLHGNEGLKVWDTETGQLVRHFPTGGSSGALFSPDGRLMLAKGANGCRMVKIERWQEGPELGWQGGAFSPDTSLFAEGTNNGSIRLLRPDSGRELARLEDPYQDQAGDLAFTPDGTKLIVSSDDGKAIHVWDLRLIRRQLLEMGLDWDAPALVEAAESKLAAAKTPLQMEVDPPYLGRHLTADALRLLREAIKTAPTHAQAHDDLAWLLVTGPVELRQPREALDLARKAVKLAPHRNDYQNTLGVALYRNGQFAEAVPVLERSLRLSKGVNDSHDLFFLAMCHHRLGHAKEAKEYQKRAVDWFQKNRLRLPGHWAAELTAFQTEAEAELDMPGGEEGH